MCCRVAQCERKVIPNGPGMCPTSIFGIRHGGHDGGTRLGTKCALAQLVGFVDEENAALGSLGHRGMFCRMFFWGCFRFRKLHV